MLIFTPENRQLLRLAAFPPLLVRVKYPVPTSILSYFFMISLNLPLFYLIYSWLQLIVKKIFIFSYDQPCTSGRILRVRRGRPAFTSCASACSPSTSGSASRKTLPTTPGTYITIHLATYIYLTINQPL